MMSDSMEDEMVDDCRSLIHCRIVNEVRSE